jgi:hypothetical protein
MRMLGRILLVLLVVAPILTRLGLSDSYGLISGFVDIETHAVGSLVSAARQVLRSHNV